MGQLNSKVLGAIANSFGDNSLFNSPGLDPAMRIQVDADRYRRKFRSVSVVQLVTVAQQTLVFKFRPGDVVAWRVLSGNVVNDQPTNSANVSVSIVDPDNAIPSRVLTQIISAIPGRIGLFIPRPNASGTLGSFDAGPAIVPAGMELQVQIGASVAPFEAAGMQCELFIEEIPKQELYSKLLPTEITLS